MKVLVTGGTGFLGLHLIESLLDKKAEVTCVVRRDLPLRKPDVYRHLIEQNISMKVGDITDYDTLRKALESDYDYIFHLAGIIRSKSREEYIKINVEGTRNLLRAINESNSNVKRLVFMSSVSAMGAITSDEPLNEEVVPKPRTPYEISKYQGELLMREFHMKYGIPVTIVRAPMIYGYGADSGLLKLVKIVDKGLLPVFDDKITLPLVYVKNLVNGLILCIEKSPRDFDVFIISDMRTYTFNEVAEVIADILKVTPMRIRVPELLIKMISSMSGQFRYIRYMTNSVRLSIKKALMELGYQPADKLKQGLKETIQYYLFNNMLNCRNFPLSPMDALQVALNEGEGLGSAYEYYVKTRVLNKCLTGANPRKVLIAHFPRVHGSAADVRVALRELGVNTTILKLKNVREISSISEKYDVVIILGDYLRNADEIISLLSRASKRVIFLTVNSDVLFHIPRWTNTTTKHALKLDFEYFDSPPFPSGIRVLSKKRQKINILLKTLMLFLALWSKIEVTMPNVAKRRVAHMVAYTSRQRVEH